MKQSQLFEDATVPNFDLDQYFTPTDLAKEFVDWCSIPHGATVLEPSAGLGALVECISIHCAMTAVELDPDKASELVLNFGDEDGMDIVEADFLEWEPSQRYDVAVMNPPYSMQPAIDALFIRKATIHCDRVCAIVRSVFFNGAGRKAICHDHAIYTRFKPLVNRPQFGGDHSPKADFMFVECRKRKLGEQQRWSFAGGGAQ